MDVARARVGGGNEQKGDMNYENGSISVHENGVYRMHGRGFFQFLRIKGAPSPKLPKHGAKASLVIVWQCRTHLAAMALHVIAAVNWSATHPLGYVVRLAARRTAWIQSWGNAALATAAGRLNDFWMDFFCFLSEIGDTRIVICDLVGWRRWSSAHFSSWNYRPVVIFLLSYLSTVFFSSLVRLVVCYYSSFNVFTSLCFTTSSRTAKSSFDKFVYYGSS